MSKTSMADTEPETEMTTIRLPIPLKNSLRELAQKEKRSLSNYLLIVLDDHARGAERQESQEEKEPAVALV